MPEKLPKIMHEWEQEMVNARKYSASQSCHADPLPYLCLKGKCMKLLHKNAQTDRKKARTNYLSCYFSKLQRYIQIKQAPYCL